MTAPLSCLKVSSATALTYKQYQKLRVLSLITATFVLMTSASVLSSDHTNSKSRGLLDAAVNSNEVSQNTAAVPSSSSLSMSSSKDFHSSTLAISSSPFEVLSAGMANKQTITPLTLVSSVLVTSSVLVSTSVVPSSALSRSYSSSVATMSSNLITEQGTSALPSVSSLIVLSSAVSLSSLPRGHLSSVVMNTTLAIDKSTPETPSPSMLLVSSTEVSQQSGTLFSDDLIEIQWTLQSNVHVRPSRHPPLTDHVSKLPKFSQPEPYNWNLSKTTTSYKRPRQPFDLIVFRCFWTPCKRPLDARPLYVRCTYHSTQIIWRNLILTAWNGITSIRTCEFQWPLTEAQPNANYGRRQTLNYSVTSWDNIGLKCV